jgi:hypothetical protein
MVKEQTLYRVSDDSATLEMLEGTRWSVEPRGLPVICTWLPTATIEIRLVDRGSVWPYELRNGNEIVRARRVYKNRKSRKKK